MEPYVTMIVTYPRENQGYTTKIVTCGSGSAAAVLFPTGSIPLDADGVTQGIHPAIDQSPPFGYGSECRRQRGGIPLEIRSDSSWSGSPIGRFKIMAGSCVRWPPSPVPGPPSSRVGLGLFN